MGTHPMAAIGLDRLSDEELAETRNTIAGQVTAVDLRTSLLGPSPERAEQAETFGTLLKMVEEEIAWREHRAGAWQSRAADLPRSLAAVG